jgi:hypothetical protein
MIPRLARPDPQAWIRLDPPTAGRHGPEEPPAAAALVAIRRVVGCRWIWWAPDAGTAWEALLATLDVRARGCVVAPVGLDSRVAEAVRRSGAAVVGVDLDPSGGFPLWRRASGRRSSAGTVYLVEHRHGRPSPLPPVDDGDIVLEDATDGVGGSVAGRRVGSLGAAGVIALGRAPFPRATGALVVSDDGRTAARLGNGFVPLDAMIEDAGGLRWDALRVEDWVDGCRAAAQVYSSAWRGAHLPIRAVEPAAETEPSWSAYLAVAPDPDGLQRALAARGVEARRPLPPALAALPAHSADRGARAFYEQVIQLPNHPELGLGELLYVADAVTVYLRGSPRGKAVGRDVP